MDSDTEASDEASDIHNNRLLSHYKHLYPEKASLFTKPHRQLLVIGINQKIAIQWDFPITYEMARAYQKANGKYLRQNQWEDITLVMSLELGK